MLESGLVPVSAREDVIVAAANLFGSVDNSERAWG